MTGRCQIYRCGHLAEFDVPTREDRIQVCSEHRPEGQGDYVAD